LSVCVSVKIAENDSWKALVLLFCQFAKANDMNFEHIVKRKTKIGTGNVNALNGYRAIEIYSPMEVVENESD